MIRTLAKAAKEGTSKFKQAFATKIDRVALMRAETKDKHYKTLQIRHCTEIINNLRTSIDTLCIKPHDLNIDWSIWVLDKGIEDNELIEPYCQRIQKAFPDYDIICRQPITVLCTVIDQNNRVLRHFIKYGLDKDGNIVFY